MQKILGMISRGWKKLRTDSKIEDFEILDFDHQPYIDCYIIKEKDGK